MTPLPAHKVCALHDTLRAAMKHVETHTPDDVEMWSRLNHAAAFVSAYLIEQMPAVPVTITHEVTA